MLRTRERAHFGRRIERVAEPDRTGQGNEAIEEFVGDLFVQEQARAGDAGLPLVVEDGPGRAVHRGGEIRAVKDDVSALAAELELHFLQVSGAGLDDAPAGGRRAGERDLR